MQEHGFNIHAIHTEPIIQDEGYYKNFSPDDRKRLFNDLLLFTRHRFIRKRNFVRFESKSKPKDL